MQIAWLPAALQLGGAVMSGIGAYQQSRPLGTQAISPGEVAGYMSPVQANINRQMAGQQQMAGLGQSMMDPQSGYNLQQKGIMQGYGANQQALQAILNQRQAAASGIGAGSGLFAAQQRAQGQQLSQSLGSQYQNMLAQNRTQGIGLMGNAQTLLGNINRQQLGVSENIGQAAIAQREWQRAEEARQQQATGQMYGAFGTGLGAMATGVHEMDMAKIESQAFDPTEWIWENGQPVRKKD